MVNFLKKFQINNLSLFKYQYQRLKNTLVMIKLLKLYLF